MRRAITGTATCLLALALAGIAGGLELGSLTIAQATAATAVALVLMAVCTRLGDMEVRK